MIWEFEQKENGAYLFDYVIFIGYILVIPFSH